MFSLEKLDLSNFITYNVKNMSAMFFNCSNLQFLDISNFNVNKNTNVNLCFNGLNMYFNIITNDRILLNLLEK